jgi:seryl-tRNA synthetase
MVYSERRKEQNRVSAAKSKAKRMAAQVEADKKTAALAMVLAKEIVRLRAELHALEHPPPPLTML